MEEYQGMERDEVLRIIDKKIQEGDENAKLNF